MVLEAFGYTTIQFYLPLPICVTLNSISPIIIYIYDYFLYGIAINRKQAIFIMISFIGVMLTANGAYLMSIFYENY